MSPLLKTIAALVNYKCKTFIKLTPGNILDLVFTNNNAVVSVKITPRISDHDIVSFTVNLAPKKKRLAKRKIYIRKRTDQEKLNKQLRSFATRFVNSTTNMSVDGKWKVFVQNITFIHKLSSSSFKFPWSNRSLHKQTRKKQRLYNKAKKSGFKSDCRVKIQNIPKIC